MSDVVIAAAIWALADRDDGQITPETVVNAASDPRSPLHRYFTWDDAQAAQERRLEQARTLIRSVKIEVRTETLAVKAPAFIRDPSMHNSQQGYVSLGRLQSDGDLARAAVLGEFARASAALARARNLAAALDLSDEIAAAQDRIQQLTARAGGAAQRAS